MPTQITISVPITEREPVVLTRFEIFANGPNPPYVPQGEGGADEHHGVRIVRPGETKNISVDATHAYFVKFPSGAFTATAQANQQRVSGDPQKAFVISTTAQANSIGQASAPAGSNATVTPYTTNRPGARSISAGLGGNFSSQYYGQPNPYPPPLPADTAGTPVTLVVGVQSAVFPRQAAGQYLKITGV